MIIPDVLLAPFAQNGDRAAIPQQDSSGFINFSDGYTPFYEISLTANNPQAKAVERQGMNELFYQLSQNAMAWQQMTTAPWLAGTSGGYMVNATVARVNSSGQAGIYRSLIDNNTSDPATNSSQWELQPRWSAMRANIPMPAGGDGLDSSKELISVTSGVNLDLLNNGVWEFASDAAANAANNIPTLSGAKVGRGMHESKLWTVGGTSQAGVQRYSAVASGRTFFRTYNGSTFSPWYLSVVPQDIQNGTFTFSVAGGTAPNYTASVSPAPGGALPVGAQITLFFSDPNPAGAATLNLNGSGAGQIINEASGALTGGELNGFVTLVLSNGFWKILSTQGIKAQVSYAVSDVQLPTFGQVKEMIAALGKPDYSNVTNTPANSFGIATNSANAFAVTITPIYNFAVGKEITVYFGTPNTGGSTLNLNGSGANTVLDARGNLLTGGELSGFVQFVLSGGGWRITSSNGVNAQNFYAATDYQLPVLKQVKELIAPYANPEWANVQNKPNVAVQGTSPAFISLELGQGIGAGNAFIDFHYGSDGADFNFRIINAANGVLSFVSPSGAPIYMDGNGFHTNGLYASTVLHLTGAANSAIYFEDGAGAVKYLIGDNGTSGLDFNVAGVNTAIRISRTAQVLFPGPRPAFSTGTPWDSGNFNPATKLTVSATQATQGTEFDSQIVGNFANVSAGSNTWDNSQLALRIGATASNGASAGIGYVRWGAYGVIMGLDTDNVMKIGGWSMGAAAYPILHTGNLADNVGAAMAANAYNAVGQVGMFVAAGAASSVFIPPGTLWAGSNLIYSCVGYIPSGTSAISPPGTWQCVSWLFDGDGAATNSIGVFRRVS